MLVDDSIGSLVQINEINSLERAALTQGREDIDYAAYWEDMAKWSFGHPALRRCPDGWLLAWYAGSPDRMSIHWARVAARH